MNECPNIHRQLNQAARWSGLACCLLILTGCAIKMGSAETKPPAWVKECRPPTEKAPAPIFFDFENDTENWTLPGKTKIAKGEGRNGTKALVLARTDPAKYYFPRAAVKLEPGRLYRLSGWAKAENLKGERRQAKFVIQSYNGKEYLTASKYIHIGDKEPDWQYYETQYNCPANADRNELIAYINRGTTGKAWFDDLKIETAAPHWTLYLASPRYNALQRETIDFKFKLNVVGLKTDEFMTMGLYVLARVSADGVHIEKLLPVQKEVKRINKTRRYFNLLTGSFEFPLNSLPAGKLTINLSLLDKKNKAILKETEVKINLLDPEKLPEHYCLIDEDGTAIVDGEPFLPIGLYHGRWKGESVINREFIDQLNASPFNCFLAYAPYFRRLEGFGNDKKYGPEAMRTMLDYCATSGVKMIFAMNAIFKESSWGKRPVPIWGADTPGKIAARFVNELKNHPAILGWYICDELPLTALPQMVERRRLVNRLDPYHPTYAVLMQFQELMGYGQIADVLGVDPYPILLKEDRDIDKVRWAMDMARAAGLPTWPVPQIFNWGGYRAKDAKAYATKYRYPTQEEIRAMCLLEAIKGARGFVMFISNGFSCKYDPNPEALYKQHWKEVCEVAAGLKELAPFILSKETPPPLTLKVLKGQVAARAFQDAQGRVRILVAASGPGEARAEISVSGGKPLKSKFGLTRRTADGGYLFSRQDVGADILTSE